MAGRSSIDNPALVREGRRVAGQPRNRAFVVVCAIAIRAVMEFVYATHVVPEFEYAGFNYFPETWYNTLTYVVTLLFAFIVPIEASPSKTFTLLAYFIFVIPFGLISAACDLSLSYYVLVVVFFAILLVVVLAGQPRPLKMPDITYGREMFVIIATGSVGVALFLFVLGGGLPLISLDIFNVYDVRWEINEILTGPLGYLVEWCKYVFAPGLLAFSIWRRNWLYIAGSLAVFTLLFAITSAKAMAFYPILIFVVLLAVRLKRMAQVVSLSVLGVTCVGWLGYVFMGSNFLSQQILVRLLFVPSLDAHRYYEHFVNSEKMQFRNTLLGAPFRTVEYDNIALVIGQDTWGYGSEVYVNTGVFATAYMHLGWVGMVIFPVLVGVSLRLLDRLAVGRVPLEIAVPFTIIAAAQYLQSDFTTTLFSHGLMLVYLSLVLIGRRSLEAGAAAVVPPADFARRGLEQGV